MPCSLPELAVVRDSLRELVTAEVDLDRLEATYLQAGRQGPSRVLYQAPRRHGNVLRVTARRVDTAKGWQLAAAINAGSVLDAATLGASQAAFFAPRLNLLFQVFPTDRRLPLLPVAVDPSAMLPILAKALADRACGRRLLAVAVHVMRYKPERKCLFRYDLSWSGGEATGVPSVVWARMSRGPKFERTCDILPRLHVASAQLGFDVPEPLGVVPELNLELFGPVPGSVLFELVQRRGFPLLCRRVGEALCRFHAVGVEVDVVMGVEAQLARLAENAAEFAWMLPAEQSRIATLERELATRLRAMAPAHLGLIHRDFHGDNVLVSDGRLILLDFEDCAMGEPADDVGSNWAQLTWHSREAGAQPDLAGAGRREFLAGYLANAAPTTAACLPAYAAMHCFLYAQQCLRHPQNSSRFDDAQVMLSACERVLQHGLE